MAGGWPRAEGLSLPVRKPSLVEGSVLRWWGKSRQLKLPTLRAHFVTPYPLLWGQNHAYVVHHVVRGKRCLVAKYCLAWAHPRPWTDAKPKQLRNICKQLQKA